MTTEKHTSEPWGYRHRGTAQLLGGNYLVTNGSYEAAETLSEANARRIVAAINACKGIATEELEVLSDGELAAALTAFIDREVAQMRRGTAELLRRLSRGESPC